MKIIALAVPLMMMSAAATAQQGGEIGYPQGSLGYDALVNANYGAAEAQILASSKVAKNDPARLINLGQIYAQTGRTAEAVDVLRQAIAADEVELILANGDSISSRDAARKVLSQLQK